MGLFRSMGEDLKLSTAREKKESESGELMFLLAPVDHPDMVPRTVMGIGTMLS